MEKPGLVVRSKCWLKNLLNLKKPEREPSRHLTLEKLEFIAAAVGIDRDTGSPKATGAGDIPIHRILNILHLDHEEIARREPRTYQDLIRTCLECAHSKDCSRGFKRMRSVETWPSYCPNAMTLKSLLS